MHIHSYLASDSVWCMAATLGRDREKEWERKREREGAREIIFVGAICKWAVSGVDRIDVLQISTDVSLWSLICRLSISSAYIYLSAGMYLVNFRMSEPHRHVRHWSRWLLKRVSSGCMIQSCAINDAFNGIIIARQHILLWTSSYLWICIIASPFRPMCTLRCEKYLPMNQITACRYCCRP